MDCFRCPLPHPKPRQSWSWAGRCWGETRPRDEVSESDSYTCHCSVASKPGTESYSLSCPQGLTVLSTLTSTHALRWGESLDSPQNCLISGSAVHSVFCSFHFSWQEQLWWQLGSSGVFCKSCSFQAHPGDNPLSEPPVGYCGKT